MPGYMKNRERRADEMAALEAIGRDVSSTLDLPSVLDRILLQAADLLDSPHGFIYLVNRELGLLERKAGIGIFSENRVIQLKPGEGLSGQVWQSGQSIVVEDYDHWAGPVAPGVGLVHSQIGIPLYSGSEVVGVLALASDRSSQRTFGDQEVELLNALRAAGCHRHPERQPVPGSSAPEAVFRGVGSP